MGFGLLVLLGISNPTALNAQCAMACNKKVQISIDTSCYLEVLPDMILEAPQWCPNGDFEVVVMDKDTVLASSPFVGPDYLWKNLQVKVLDRVSGNSCWGNIYVEDKQPPIIVCRNDTLHCNALPYYEGPEMIEHCDTGSVIKLLREEASFFSCDSAFTKQVTRYYVAEDSYGNRSLVCTIQLLLRRVDIDSVIFPKDLVKADSCALACDSIYQTDANGFPHPDVTGVPMLDSFPLWPDFAQYCNISVDYKDQLLVDEPCKKKILRTWRLVEWWCNDAIITSYPQIIEILDEEGPQIQCPRDWVMSTDGGYQCEASIDLPPAEVYDLCAGDSVTVDIHYPGGVLKNSNGGRIKLPAGDHVIEYIAYDPCYNMSRCTMHITVLDKTPPVTVCEKHTVATLNEHGEIHVYADVLDDGTFDDCYLDSFAVKRMDEGAACNAPDSLFMPYVRLCCADAGQAVMVIFRAWDHAGNYNDCMVEVEVQDKLPPRIYCPDPMRVSCYDWVDSLDYTMFGDPTYTDNCNVMVTERVDRYINQCRIGTVERVFVATDDGGRSDSCRQVIEIYDPTPFVADSIIWPLDFVSNAGCMAGSLEPDQLEPPYDIPIVQDDECSLIAMSYEDEIFRFVPDSNACFKIIRTWKVIDWCTFDRYGNYMQYTHQQVIKVNNTNAPVIVEGCAAKSICTYDADCNDGYIQLVARAQDDCTPGEDLIWHVQIDLDDDQIIDYDWRGYGDSIDVSDEYPIGRHRIKYSFEDLCGNKGTCTTYFEIVNCKLPTAYCLNGIAVDLMPQDTNGDGAFDWGMVEIWASDFDLGSFHCNDDLTFSFSRDTTEKARMFDCDSLGMRYVEMWVTDRQSGNQTYCRTHIVVQDNNDACPDTMTLQAAVAGLIVDDEGRPLEDVDITLQGPIQVGARSNADGVYAFQGLELGHDYEVRPGLTGDPMEGVSTYDLVAIQQHLLGIKLIDNPYRMLAADVDGSESISSRDLLQIRKLILGLEKDFGGLPPWRFVQTGYQFADPANPFGEAAPESFSIQQLAGDMMYVDFTGIKLGDINGSYRGLRSGLETRSPLPVTADIQELAPGEFELTLRTDEEIPLAGVQFTLEYEPDRWYWDGNREAPEAASFNAEMAEVWPGQISYSWMNPEGTGNFELRFRLKGDHAAPSVRISSGVTRAEAYTLSGEEMPLKLNLLQGHVADTRLRAIPNPFGASTTLRFDVPEGAVYRIELVDMAGVVHFSREKSGIQSHETVVIDGAMLPAHGMYYAVLSCGGIRKVEKLVFLPQ